MAMIASAGSNARERWFELEAATLTASSGTGYVPQRLDTGELVQVERVDTDCCGCCATGRRTDADSWRGLDGRLRQQTGGMGIVGGLGFVLAIVGIVLLTLLVWSLDSFGDVDGTSELGSGDD